MTFSEVIAELQRLKPNAPTGLTAQQGQYYDQAITMQFQRQSDLVYAAYGASGKEMWVYYSEHVGRICCGNKE